MKFSYLSFSMILFSKALIRRIVPMYLFDKTMDILKSFSPSPAHTLKQLEIIKKKTMDRFSDPKQQKDYFASIEGKVYSQNGEDGIIVDIIDRLNIKQGHFFEVGVEDGKECNCAYLALQKKWSGVMVEGSSKHAQSCQEFYQGSGVKVINAFVTPSNIELLLKEAQTNHKIDLLSIDIDSNDYWVFDKVQNNNAKIIILEYNSYFGPDRSQTVVFDPSFERFKKHYSGYYFGASLSAFSNSAKSKGYALVCCDSHGVNAFFVRKDLLEGSGLLELSPSEAFYAISSSRKREPIEVAYSRIKHLPFVHI